MKLTDREFKEFKVKQIFTIEKCKCSNASSLKEGEFPYIGATNRNNGIMSLVERKDSWVSKGNCIVFICDGQGSVGYSIYKAEDFIGSTTLKIGRTPRLNNNNAQFLISALDKNRVIYSYGYKRSEKRLLNETILLPFDENGDPDYAFMEEYVKVEEKHKKEKYITYAKKQLETLQYIEVPALEEKEWGEFSIGGDNGIFIISSGKRLTKADMDNGKIPFIGATDSNNGITNWVGTPNSTLDSNVLGVNYNGSVVENFYHPYLCVFSDDVKRLHLKNYKDNKYILLFLKSIILNQKNKYTYGYKFNAHRMERQKILLPIDEHGTPDYAYMEQYAKNLIIVKLKKYLAFAKKK